MQRKLSTKSIAKFVCVTCRFCCGFTTNFIAAALKMVKSAIKLSTACRWDAWSLIYWPFRPRTHSKFFHTEIHVKYRHEIHIELSVMSLISVFFAWKACGELKKIRCGNRALRSSAADFTYPNAQVTFAAFLLATNKGEFTLVAEIAAADQLMWTGPCNRCRGNAVQIHGNDFQSQKFLPQICRVWIGLNARSKQT